MDDALPLSSEQRQSLLRQGVGLCQRSNTSLHQDLILGEDRGLERDIGITDPRFCSREVFARDLQIRDGRFKPILNRPVIGSCRCDGTDRVVNIA